MNQSATQFEEYINEGNQCFSTAENAIFILGNKRSGKTTFYNWIRGIRLYGLKGKRDICYFSNYMEAGKVNDGYKSITIVPNLGKIDIGGVENTVVDFPGFQNREYEKAFMLPYMLNKSIDFFNKTKFIIMHQSSSFLCSEIQVILKPFINFFEMFNETLFENDQILEKLMKSVILVISKAHKMQDYYLQTLNMIISELNEIQQYDFTGKIIRKAIKSIIGRKAIFLFQQAEENQLATIQNSFFEFVASKEWTYHDWENNRKYLSISFEKAYSYLSENEKKKLKRINQNKIHVFQEYEKLLFGIFNQIIKRSEIGMISWSQHFSKIKQINQKYSKKKYSQVGKPLSRKIVKPNITLFSNLQRGIKIIEEIERDSHIESNFQELKNKFELFFEYLKNIMCSCEEEESLFEAFISFFMKEIIFLRTLSLLGNQFNATLKLLFQNVSQFWKRNNIPYSLEFLLQFKHKKEEECMQALEQIEFFLESWSHSLQSKKKQLLANKKVKLFIALAEYANKNKNYNSAIQLLFTIWNSLKGKLKKNHKGEYEEEGEYRIRQIFSRVGENLLQIGSVQLAFQVFKMLNHQSKVDICFTRIIEKEKSIYKKFEQMKKYGQFCQGYGRIQQAIKIYQKMLQQFICLYPTKKKEIVIKLRDCILKQQSKNTNSLYLENQKLILDQVLIEKIEKQSNNLVESNQNSFQSEDYIFQQQLDQKSAIFVNID